MSFVSRSLHAPLKKTPNWENTLSDRGSIHGHRNLNETECSVIARHQNFNAPKICKITVHRRTHMHTDKQKHDNYMTSARQGYAPIWAFVEDRVVPENFALRQQPTTPEKRGQPEQTHLRKRKDRERENFTGIHTHMSLRCLLFWLVGPTVILGVYSCLHLGSETGRLWHASVYSLTSLFLLLGR